MQFVVGDNVSEFEWIFRRYPFVVNILNDNTTESGGTALFTVKLDSEPTANVTIPISSDNISEGTVSVSSVTFTSSNWASEQTVTVTGVDDYKFDDNVTYSIVFNTTLSNDENYNGIRINYIDIVNYDNDLSDQNLISYFNFNEQNLDLKENLSLSSENTFQYANDRYGNQNNALYISSNYTYSVPFSTQFDFDKNYTICFELNIEAIPSDYWLSFLSKGSGTNAQFRFQRYENSNFFAFAHNTNNGRAKLIKSLTAFSTNIWYHICGRANDNELSIFINGLREIGTNSAFSSSYSNNLTKGENDIVIGEKNIALNFAIDNLLIYSRALSDNEISNLYTP